MSADVCAMAVMAKAPQPGRSKTRLVPPLNPEQAAALSAAFLRDITENIAAAGRETPVQGMIAFAPAGAEPLFDLHIAAGTGFVLADGTQPAPQGVEGFGRCLLHAMESLLAQGFGAVCLVNSDSPTLPTALLVRAAMLLAAPGERVVLGPADDGGYYLIGLKTAHSHLFSNIAWSTGTVAAQTIERAQELGLPVETLPAWYDVDDAAALARLKREAGAPAMIDGLMPYAAPASAACLAGMGLVPEAPET